MMVISWISPTARLSNLERTRQTTLWSPDILRLESDLITGRAHMLNFIPINYASNAGREAKDRHISSRHSAIKLVRKWPFRTGLLRLSIQRMWRNQIICLTRGEPDLSPSIGSLSRILFSSGSASLFLPKNVQRFKRYWCSDLRDRLQCG